MKMKMSSNNDDICDDRDREPVAGLSAASSCIILSLCLDNDRKLSPSSQFFPVYTHQCFPAEYISGWQPMSSAEQSSQQVYQRWRYGSVGEAPVAMQEKHASYKNIDGQEKQIEVNVLLSPSCDKCKIGVTTSTPPPLGSNVNTDEPATKKVKKVTFEEADDKSTKQLSIDDVIKKIQSSIPPIVSVTINGSSTSTATDGAKTDTTDFNYLSHPIGAVVKSYKRKIKYNNDTVEEGDFVITLAKGSDPSVASYHNAIQPLARWFIETADDVNISDEDGGFWTVMYLFRKHDDKSPDNMKSSRYSLAGYITLFHFHAPFRKPNPGIIVRVCQALILPTYQRAGHGSDLLLSVHEYADRYLEDFASPSTGMDIVEVNVEDPAPGFVALRDSVDYKRFVSLSESMRGTIGEFPDVTSKDYFQPSHDVLSISSLLKITKCQTEMMHEIYKLAAVERWKKDSKDNERIQQVETNYRLMVKKSLRSHRTEELGACEGGKEEQKALLAKWFDQTHNQYRKILGLV
mmetsp:Transcript_20479/g.33711  ORF Transcript_20479/g.33711 Transcript_20479/m.33711 type:complete len:518 (+) Transcript_20479:83-1636(+)